MEICLRLTVFFLSKLPFHALIGCKVIAINTSFITKINNVSKGLQTYTYSWININIYHLNRPSNILINFE